MTRTLSKNWLVKETFTVMHTAVSEVEPTTALMLISKLFQNLEDPV